MSAFSEKPGADIHTPLPELNIQDLEHMNDEEFWSYASQRAHNSPEPSLHVEYIECKLSNGTCLLALSDLVEVLSPPHRLARLPGMPAWMGGILAWRGATIAVVDLDHYLSSIASKTQLTQYMVLVARSTDKTLGLLVPALGLTRTIEQEQITSHATFADPPVATHRALIVGINADTPILNTSVLLTALVQQIGTATAHG